MKPRNLLTIDKLIQGVHYIQYVDKAKEDNHNYAERIVGYVKNGNKKQAILLLGEYRIIHDIPQFIFDNHTVYQESINEDTGNYQSLPDFVEDLNRSGEIQKHALRNTMAREITTKLGNPDVSLDVLKYLEHALETKYPTGNKKYVPIFKKEIGKLNPKKAEEEESGIIGVELSNSLKNKPNNYDSRESNILYNLRTIFNNWTISKSSSKVHIESNSPPRSPPRSNSPPHSPRFKKGKSGGKRKTRNHKKTKKTRKTKRHR